MNRTRTLLRGSIATLGLGLLLVGLPVALLAAVGNPLPRHLASWTQMRLAIDSGNVADQTILRAFALVLWVIWAYLVWSAIGEARTALRAHRAGRPIVYHRALMGRLVVPALTAALMVVGRAPLPAFAATAPAVATSPMSTTAVPSAPTVGGQGLAVVVAPGDNLATIAQRALGSADRWSEIFTLNQGRPQPGGGSLTDPALIQPGWRLALPGGGASAPKTTVPSPFHTVQAGETLSGIAEHYYGDASQWRAIATANPGVASDPGLIHPGQVLLSRLHPIPRLPGRRRRPRRLELRPPLCLHAHGSTPADLLSEPAEHLLASPPLRLRRWYRQLGSEATVEEAAMGSRPASC